MRKIGRSREISLKEAKKLSKLYHLAITIVKEAFNSCLIVNLHMFLTYQLYSDPR